MSQRYFTKYLKEEEELVAVVTRYPLAYAGPLAVTAGLILAAFFFLYPLFRLGSWGIASWLVLLLTAVIYGGRQLYIALYNALLITDRRLIDVDQRGFFHRSVSEMTYDTLQDITVNIHGLWQTFLNVGDLHIQSAGAQTNLEIDAIHHPERVQEMILAVRDRLRASAITDSADERLTADELIVLLNRIKRGLGPERLRRLLDDHPPTAVSKRRR